jgi:hypothetical protein
MFGDTSWTHGQKLLYVSLVPAAAVLAGVLLLSMAHSPSGGSRPAAAPTPAALAQQAAERARDEQRDRYRQCLHEMGGDFPRARTRFSRPPDMRKIREAMNVCSALLQGGGGPGGEAPAPRTKTIAPPVA